MEYGGDDECGAVVFYALRVVYANQIWSRNWNICMYISVIVCWGGMEINCGLFDKQ